ncbi:MAG TPA: hypothetical protein VG870_08355 [Chitinophagaceae bacterium]|nr:hypothetical protein [Chitinophagaceae bacterium]
MSLNDLTLPTFLLADLYGRQLVEPVPSNPADSRKISPATETARPTPRQAEAAVPAPAKAAAVQEKKSPATLPSLGNNGKNILVLVRHQEVTHLPDAELMFLVSMLSACKLGLEDVAVFNLHNQPDAGYRQLLDHFRSKTVLVFGITPAELALPVDFPLFQVQPLNKTIFLCAPGLQELESDKVLKSKLWVSLRRLFNI